MTTSHKFVTVIAALFAITIASLPTGRRGVVWACTQSVQTIERITHLSSFTLDRLDPLSPHVIQPNRWRLYECHFE